MATVYLAHDLKHHRRVALKVLRPELDHGARRRTGSFARSRSRPSSPIPTSSRCSTRARSDGCLYYVMPYVAGEIAADRLSREDQLPVEDAVEIACEVADALAYAHRQAWSIATSSRRTSCWKGAMRWWPTSASPGRSAWPRRERPPAHQRRARAGHAALHESGAGGRPTGSWTGAPTSTAWAACCTRCSPASLPSPDPPPRRSWPSTDRSRLRRSGKSAAGCRPRWSRWSSSRSTRCRPTGLPTRNSSPLPCPAIRRRTAPRPGSPRTSAYIAPPISLERVGP